MNLTIFLKKNLMLQFTKVNNYQRVNNLLIK